MKSKPPAADQRVEAAGAELADLGLDGVHLLRREHPRQQAPVHVVGGRVLEEDRARAGSRCRALIISSTEPLPEM